MEWGQVSNQRLMRDEAKDDAGKIEAYLARAELEAEAALITAISRPPRLREKRLEKRLHKAIKSIRAAAAP